MEAGSIPGYRPTRSFLSRAFGFSLATMLLLLTMMSVALAQDQTAEEPQKTDPGPRDTFFEHSKTAKWWISGQANIVFQTHGDFYAQYSGPNSLKNHSEQATSRVLTLFTGYEFTPHTIGYFDMEETGWGGISGALGLAGFVNLDVVRNPALSKTPYIARAMIQQIIPLSSETMEVERTPLSLSTQVPVRRLEIRFGKMSLPDFMDANVGGTDSHYQFLNWVIANNGAWDYAADTRGYTVAALFDYEDRNWGLRFAEALMPKVANGPNLDADVARARAENIELELRPKLLKDKDTTLRLLSYVNHANMGDYQQAILLYLNGLTPTPDVTATRIQGAIKYGFGVNLEQEVSKDIWFFGRWGWNEGNHESFAYTEDNEGVELGGYAKGTRWHRTLDRAGVAFVTSGLSKPHYQYLGYGGLGFILGDGAINYAREDIWEAFYTTHIWRGLFFAFDLQHVTHPGMNQARGPVTVPGLRLHFEF
jgi:hypothetical protein